MARRPSKCRVCGHRFASGEDICPECFTAREDDISCDNAEKSEHSHGRDYSTVGRSDVFEEFETESFVDEQREDEAKDPIPSATYGGKQGPAPQTYAGSTYSSQPYTSPTNFDYSAYEPKKHTSTATDSSFGGFTEAGRDMYSQQGSASGSRAEKLAAIRNGTYQSTYGGQKGLGGYSAYPGAQYQYGYNTPRRNTSGSKVAAVIIIIMVMAFFIPLIVMIATFSSSTGTSESSAQRGHVDTVSIEIPDFSAPDISFPDFDYLTEEKYTSRDFSIRAHDLRMGQSFTYGQAKEFFPQDELPYFFSDRADLRTDDARMKLAEVCFDIRSEGDYNGRISFYDDEVRCTAYDVLGQELTISYGAVSLYEEGLNMISFIVPDETFRIELSIPIYLTPEGESMDTEDCDEIAIFSIDNYKFAVMQDGYDRNGKVDLPDAADNSDENDS